MHWGWPDAETSLDCLRAAPYTFTWGEKMTTQIWDDYEIQMDQVLGRGGMGTVFRGRQISLDRPVAIKVLSKDLTENVDFVQRFQREARLLSRLVDNHVVQVYGAGVVQDRGGAGLAGSSGSPHGLRRVALARGYRRAL